MHKLEKDIRRHLKDRKWDNLRPSDVAKSIVIEAAELLELFQWESVTIEDVKKNKEKLHNVEKELADVLTYAIDLAVLLDLDTEKIIRKKLAAVQKKYPASLFKKLASQEPGTEAVYWKIKEEYRKKRKS